MKNVVWSLVLVAGMLVPAGAMARDTDVEAMARRLAALRSEVEALSGDLEAQKEEHRAQLRSLAEQKAELEIQLGRETLRSEQLAEAQTRQQAVVRDQTDVSVRLEPIVLSAIQTMKTRVQSGLPFQVEERLAELEKLEDQLSGKLIRSQDAVHRLWLFVEDELRLERESGLYRQTIQLDGEELLADVARLGMVALYFQTSDGRTGRAVKTPVGWKYEVLDGHAETTEISALFDAFKKQIRVGYFDVPNAFPEEAR